MNTQLKIEPNKSFLPVENPDEVMQYRRALDIIMGLSSSTNAASVDTNDKGSGSLKTSASEDMYPADWLCVSVWRKAVLNTSDDRLQNDKSRIGTDLQNWDEWLQKRLSNSVKMLSLKLLECADIYPYSVYATTQKTSVEKELKSVTVIEGKFDAFHGVVDSVSSDMAASHLLWVYKKGEPVYSTAHYQDATSLSMQLETIIMSQSEKASIT